MAHNLGGIGISLAAQGRIGPDDVLAMRRETFKDGVVSAAEAEALFGLNAANADQCPEWTIFFVEALTDYAVHQAAPQGHISDENANWLVKQISKDGKVEQLNELELLVKVLEAAQTSPATLATYALRQVTDAVMNGNGPLAKGGALEAGVINKAEVDLMRRILHAMSGEGGVGISREEAELLFNLNDRTAHEKNDPAWNELFVKSIANYVLGYSRYAVATREQATRRQAFLDKETPGILGTLGGMFNSSGLGEALRGLFDEGSTLKQRNEAFDAGVHDAERVEAAEAKWLIEKIGKDGSLHENERALLKFIGEIASEIHDDLKPLMAKVA